ncbi:alpha/beta fold hydrolase [Gordonia polyisoprenivorans]|uniref:alpha/beta fold hydrolase n=1 Tax=Gordonia polyisoprenivorans TaxID=84595 RepID=UPI0019E29112|nr:alpha/beta hydrolase [Gordonia polyisoprenivorans]MBE7192980.1 alpha/beta hydrolase [Gordonia polyisoprenivorans]UZF57117.1 alpha/beta hydrolase [Gordonia polyisoprenivorans]WCB38178.1 alpha/beta hydrolase [Gordonia polyisoprenivorans]
MAAPDPSSVRLPGVWRHLDVRANGLRFHAVEVDEPIADRPLVLLLHGFGEFWWSWRHQLTALTEAGHRAVAVDLRGYGDTDKPPRGYDGWTLAGDTNGLVRALGHTDATLVGHADGGLVCWATATLHPRAVSRIAVIASPHPRSLRHDVLLRGAQRTAFLPNFLRNQLPRSAEARLTRRDGAFIARYFDQRAGSAWRGTDDYAQTISLNRSAIQIPYVAHSSLEYQRWAFRSQFRPDGIRFMRLMHRRLHIPALALRGADDPYITDHAMRESREWVDHLDVREIPASGHFAHQEQPYAVTAALLELLGS